MPSDLDQTRALRPGDACQWRYPAEAIWRSGFVLVNGAGGYWAVHDPDADKNVHYLYIEHIRAPGTDPWAR